MINSNLDNDTLWREEQGKEVVVTFCCIYNLIPIKNKISETNVAKY